MSVASQFFGGERKIKLNVLVVGGGGGSGGVLSNYLPAEPIPGPVAINNSFSQGTTGAGGGGGAGVINNYFIGPGTVCPITVGAAGAAGVGIGSTTLTTGGNGGTSIFQDPTGETFTLIGGGGGGGGWSNPATLATTPGPALISLVNGLPGGSGGGGGARPATGFGGCGSGSYFTRSVRVSNSGFLDTPINEGIDIGSGTLYGFPGTNLGYSPSPSPAPAFRHAGGAGGGSDVTVSGTPAGQNPQLAPFFDPTVMRNGLLNKITGITTSYANGGAGSPTVALPPAAPGPGAPPAVSIVATSPGITPTQAIALANSGNGAVAVTNQVSGYDPSFTNVYYFSYSGPGLAGAAGVVVVSYPSAFAASPSFPGASDISPQTPGYRTYRFTSPGSITLP